MSVLFSSTVQSTLNLLHTHVEQIDEESITQALTNHPNWREQDSVRRAEIFQNAPLPISRDVGMFLYNIARSIGAKRIVEFGTSYGVSTIYLAAAAIDNGGGKVIGSELDVSKMQKAGRYLADAGLSEVVEIRLGDALETLKDIDEPIDLLFLDGWKELYLPLLKLLSSKLRIGAAVIADDLNIFPADVAEFLTYVKAKENRFASVTVPMGDGLEYSVRL